MRWALPQHQELTGPAQTRPRERGESLWHRVQVNRWSYAYIAPFLVLVAVFTIYPIFASLGYTLYQWNGVGNPTRYVGLQNFAQVLHDGIFWQSFLHTFLYTADALVVMTVRGATSLWCSIPQFAYLSGKLEFADLEPEPFHAADAESRSTTLPLSSPGMPSLLCSWEALVTAAATAPSCSTLCCDGISYRHRVRASGVVIDAEWMNPSPREHAAQVELITAYGKLLDLADLFPEEREEAERRRLQNREKRLARKQRKQKRNGR